MEAEGQLSKLVSDIPDPDIAISMGCNVGCPFIGRPFDDNWGLEDPTGKSDEDFKIVIDNGDKTAVSEIAGHLYNKLTSARYRVFFIRSRT